MKLRKDTIFVRAALSQEWRQIVLAEDNAPADSIRKVLVSVPYGTEIYLSTDEDADKLYGTNRTYKGPIARPGAEQTFNLRPNQVLWGATAQGISSLGITIEFHAGD